MRINLAAFSSEKVSLHVRLQLFRGFA